MSSYNLQNLEAEGAGCGVMLRDLEDMLMSSNAGDSLICNCSEIDISICMDACNHEDRHGKEHKAK